MQSKLSEFSLAVVFLLLFPLLPLLFEFWISGTVGEAAAIVVASMYSFSIGFTTRLRFLFGFAIFIGVILAMAYGATMISPKSLVHALPCSLFAIGCFFLAQCLERYKIHVIDGDPFLFHQ